MWKKPIAEPNFVKFMQLQSDNDISRAKEIMPAPRLIESIEMMYDKENMRPVDTGHKYYSSAWPDVKNCDQPDWLVR